MRKYIKVIAAIFFGIQGLYAQQNSFPLLSSGQYTGGSGDYTSIGNPHLKLVGTTSYPRIVHLSVNGNVSAVYNFETGKNAYWGEPGDIGKYLFRGRDLVVEQGSLQVNSDLSVGGQTVIRSNVNSIWLGDNDGGDGLRSTIIKSGDQDRITLKSNGLIGFGVTSPNYNFSFAGGNSNISVGDNVFINGQGSTGRITNNAYMNNGWQTHDTNAWASTIELRDNSCIDMYGTVSKGDVSNWRHMFGFNAKENKVYFPNGNVGIGTTDPKSKLAVNGQIRATEVKILADISVPDYVFEPDYDLRSLEETEQYIDKNKHLPEIPSASEIGENGIDLGEMNMKLLQKVEELTLYLIDQNKELKEAKSEIRELREEMERLKN